MEIQFSSHSNSNIVIATKFWHDMTAVWSLPVQKCIDLLISNKLRQNNFPLNSQAKNEDEMAPIIP